MKNRQGDVISLIPKDGDHTAPDTTNQAIENTVSQILFEIAKPVSEQDLIRKDLLLD
jgi:hypothetical protein